MENKIVGLYRTIGNMCMFVWRGGIGCNIKKSKPAKASLRRLHFNRVEK